MQTVSGAHLTFRFSGEDGDETSGPWGVHVLEINPDLYDGTITPELATEIVPERATLTSISDRTDSLDRTGPELWAS